MASYLSSKKSPTVSNLEKMNVVVTPEDKNDIHLGKAVIHDLREIVDKTKLLRIDGARTAISIITASTNGSNIQNEKKKVLLGKKIGLPKKHIHPQLSEKEKISSPYEHLTDIAVATFSGKDTTNDCFNKACLDRKCTECGVRLLDFSDQELSDHQRLQLNYFETSHAKGPQDAAGGFLKNHVDLVVLRGSAVVQNAHDFFNYCEKNLKDTKSHYCRRRIFRFVDTINRDSVKAYKPIPGIRSLHQVLNSEPEKLTVRYMSCYSCEECVNGNYNICTNNAIGRKEVVPIRPDDKGTIDDDENDNEYTMSDLIVEGTVLALYTEKENAEFYLLRASSCPEKLRTSEVDDWGVSFRKNTKIIRGQYFKSDLNRSKLSYKLIRRKKAIVPEASVIYISPQLRVNSRFALTFPETVHLDILSVLDEMES
ncbi:unnamed protein product [Mytilus coruscus]|uniref:Uncharacterized protein n=1 Tax=Mytilus coruscus TaxID=42192 RepID=A0A6J8ATA4_MYTCO|nr:unnamed protein product [Mytilus coruscus]